MDARTIVTRGVTTGLRLGRGTADRLVGAAGPSLGRFTDRVVSKVRRPDQPTTTTFIPSKRTSAAPEQQDEPTGAPPRPKTPSPSVVARNIGPARPTAKPPRATKPRSAPGAKLPPPRPSTS